jgi:hypothetical protein
VRLALGAGDVVDEVLLDGERPRLPGSLLDQIVRKGFVKPMRPAHAVALRPPPPSMRYGKTRVPAMYSRRGNGASYAACALAGRGNQVSASTTSPGW